MSLEVIKEINIDFHDKKYISINAKQYDKLSRFVLVTCYNQKNVYHIDNNFNSAYIRYRKSDDLGVFNKCKITDDGKIFIELTEQMLAIPGTCYADLIILNKISDNDDNTEAINNWYHLTHSYDGNGNVTFNTSDFVDVNNDSNGNITFDNISLGDIITDGKYSILSTMTFCINVIETAFDNVEIESSYEYNALNDLLIKATEDYESVITACKTYEINAKTSEENAKTSEDNAKISEENSNISEENAKIYADNAKISEDNAKIYETNAKVSEDNAKLSENNAKISEENAKESENNAVKKAEESSQSASESANSATISSNKATESSNSALLSQSYAIGKTGIRVNEDVDNAKYYYTHAKTVSDSINGSFSPMGTIEFSKLQSILKDTGYMYCISDDFVTDDTFKCGAGVSYPAGTNIYYTSDGYWDCMVTKTLVVTDDGDGIVTIEYSVDSITTEEEYSSLNKTIAELQNRIKMLEEQNVLGIN